jgi:twinkle protein
MDEKILPPAATSAEWVEVHIPCEACGSSDAKCVHADGHTFCFSCNKFTPSQRGDFENLSDVFTFEYLPWRGVSRATMEFYDIKTKINSEGKPVEIGFRYPNDSYKIRNLDKKAFYSKGDISKAGLFGRNKFAAGSHTCVVITEGELDAASVREALRWPVVSVHSSSSAATDVGLDRSWVNSFEKIYLAFDADGPGRDAAAKVARLFDYNKLYHVRFPGGTRKDANDYLNAGERDQLVQLFHSAKKYLPDSIVSSFNEFEKILAERPKDGIPYPFPTWNFMTYGIRTGESVLITAQEGIGKTEVMHAIEHQLLKETDDAIGAIFLEEPKARHLQAVAGLELQRPAHLPDSGVGLPEVLAAVQKAVRKDDRLHLYSHFGSDDPDTILDTIRFLVSARACRYVLLDHITMVVSGLGGKNATEALDYLSTRLEMMVKELDFALILVSHVNDDGLTRGSRNISKVADIRIDLSRDVKSVDPVIRRTTHCIISKNRFCGRTGPAGELLYDPRTHTLKEAGLEFTPANDNHRIEELVA